MLKIAGGILVAIIVGLFVNGWVSRPEIEYYLEPLPQIDLHSDNAGRISVRAINRGGTSAVAIIHCNGDNITFIKKENVPYLETRDGEIFHYVSLPRGMGTYELYSEYFYVRENAHGFNINAEVTVAVEISPSWFSLIFSTVRGTYPTAAEYIQTGPNLYSSE